MNISILCSDEMHPVNADLNHWMSTNSNEHKIELIREKCELSGGDILFLISCSEIISAKDRSLYQVSLVLHASDLPEGRGWSPHIWQIIDGRDSITLSLLEAEDVVDTGRIWQKIQLSIPEDALWNEINDRLFASELELMNFVMCKIKKYHTC